ncbi:sugar phosphate nucleotidyltransferase [Salibacterium halotolerans]|uniref:Bifunctional UDP-N-acetylglucosamine pyrophosphorylase / Glucosamine-1-phosphate N-acetyltransferase n=1 Tax=Salibacterium halotolerans TaxID=1884432 RepID=A0A1I5W660_9BACI|nr:sugar phosphate nucleotidyltransferase [Salibacterium halotolerans]SFQ15235.1 bifunctional UDP-N-acetylglucosamine pyrophosphorylase / Glucosamine-1-phosphate N-acetyltransferase [Salibacterium halotolerans]
MTRTFAVVLAAGKGTRMQSEQPKVLHHVCGKPMVQHVIDQLQNMSVERILTVVGHKADMIKQQLGSFSEYAFQPEQLGTAHAVKMCQSKLEKQQGSTLILTGDTPLITEKTLRYCLDHHQRTNAAATILTMTPDDPSGYGRIVRNKQNQVERIVEHKDATEEQLQLHEVNSGIFCFDNTLLFQALEKVSTDNKQQEYYLPDVIEILKREGEVISAFPAEHTEECFGINDRTQLNEAAEICQKRIIDFHQHRNVTISDPSTTLIEAEVTIGPHTNIEPRTSLRGRTQIGADCTVGPDVDLINYKVTDRTHIHHSPIKDDTHAKPYVH